MNRKNSPRLFRVHKGADPRSLIVRYPYQDNSDLQFGFIESARRLAASFTAEPVDDVILFPVLYLYRHGIELSLKDSIRYAVILRRRNGETEPKLTTEQTNKRLITHSIGALSAELGAHLKQLDLDAMPKETVRTLGWLAEADPNGVAFRYSTDFSSTQDFINFPELVKSLDETYRMVDAANDVLSAYSEMQDEYLSMVSEQESEYRDEMRQMFEERSGY